VVGLHVYAIAVARHALSQRSKGQRSSSHVYENRHGRTVARLLVTRATTAHACMGTHATVFWLCLYSCDILHLLYAIDMSAKALLCFRAVRPTRLSFVRSSRHILLPIYLTNGLRNRYGTNRKYSLALLITWLDPEGQRSRSQQAIEVAKASTLRSRSLYSSFIFILSFYTSMPFGVTNHTHSRE